MILAGVSELCELVIATGEEMSVPSGARLRIVAPPGVELESPGNVSMDQFVPIHVLLSSSFNQTVCVHEREREKEKERETERERETETRQREMLLIL